MDRATAFAHLKDKGLRSTTRRIRVLRGLAKSGGPVTYGELAARLGRHHVDPATVYRNLVKLTEVGLARIASRAGGQVRYELASASSAASAPQFVCQRCHQTTPVDATVTARTSIADWESALRDAQIVFEGICPNCAP